MADMNSALLRAIEGFSGANTGNKRHEGNIALLERVRADIQRGKDSGTSTVGQREARAAASQKNMPAEEGHTGGKGEQITNDPGSAHKGDRAVDLHSESDGDQLKGAGPVESRGNVLAVHSAPAAASGVQDIRKMAAAREMSRPDSKFEPIRKSGDGNKLSNLPGESPPPEGRIGRVEAPAKAPADENKGRDGWEGVPPFAKEPLSGDGWTRAREKARKLAPAAR